MTDIYAWPGWLALIAVLLASCFIVLVWIAATLMNVVEAIMVLRDTVRDAGVDIVNQMGLGGRP